MKSNLMRLFFILSSSGKFKDQANTNSQWLPMLDSKVPEPRPGTCVKDTTQLPDNVLNFIRSHPLMDRAVNHEHNNPVFFKRDLIFTKLVVDRWVCRSSKKKRINYNAVWQFCWVACVVRLQGNITLIVRFIIHKSICASLSSVINHRKIGQHLLLINWREAQVDLTIFRTAHFQLIFLWRN